MSLTREERRAHLQSCADTITQEAMDLWWEHATKETTASVSQLQNALPCLAELNRVYQQHPLLLWLVQRVQDTDWHVRFDAAEVLGQMGEKAATQEVLSALLGCLRDTVGFVRRAAFEALGQMGEKAATQEALSALLACLRDTDWNVRFTVVQALGCMGEKAAIQEVLSILVEWLHGTDKDVRSAAASAFRKMGEKTGTEEVLSALLGCLRDEEWYVRLCAVDMLGKMGEKAATGEVLSMLVVSLQTRGNHASDAARNLQRFHQRNLRICLHEQGWKALTIWRLARGERVSPTPPPLGWQESPIQIPVGLRLWRCMCAEAEPIYSVGNPIAICPKCGQSYHLGE